MTDAPRKADARPGIDVDAIAPSTPRDVRPRIRRLLSTLFGGDHHVDWERVKSEYNGQASYTVFDGQLSTFDSSMLTVLVIMAHQLAVRVEIRPGGPRRVKLWMSERKREGAWHERHPTLTEHLERLKLDASADLLAATADDVQPEGSGT